MCVCVCENAARHLCKKIRFKDTTIEPREGERERESHTILFYSSFDEATLKRHARTYNNNDNVYTICMHTLKVSMRG